ncbi:MAG: ribosomal-processing cysteine protease Prp [Clostridia bacterium]|nr:ribosomal-processing cysteine protease Prp [Clostridia bacterium]
MTKAEFYLIGEKISGFKVYGHSGYAEEGEDIVCASVSSTVWMTVNGLENVVGAKVTYNVTDANVTLKVESESMDEAQDLLRSFKEFLCNLSIEYEDYLTVKEVHVNV